MATFLRDLFESYRQPTTRRQRTGDAQPPYSDDEFFDELLGISHRQPTANRRITDDDKTEGNDEQRLQDLRRSDRPPATKRRIHDDEEPMAKRQETYGRAESQADAEATTVASSHEEASTPVDEKKRPTMSERAVAAPQLPGVRVPIGVLW